MPQKRTPSHLRAVTGDRKTGETAKRTRRAKGAPTPEWPDPGELPSSVRAVFDRMAPLLHARSLLNGENLDVLVRYCETKVFADGAAKELFDADGMALPLVESRDRGKVKNPAAQV